MEKILTPEIASPTFHKGEVTTSYWGMNHVSKPIRQFNNKNTVFFSFQKMQINRQPFWKQVHRVCTYVHCTYVFYFEIGQKSCKQYILLLTYYFSNSRLLRFSTLFRKEYFGRKNSNILSTTIFFLQWIVIIMRRGANATEKKTSSTFASHGI